MLQSLRYPEIELCDSVLCVVVIWIITVISEFLLKKEATGNFFRLSSRLLPEMTNMTLHIDMIDFVCDTEGDNTETKLIE